MYTSAYIDYFDLLILSYYNRSLCLNRFGDYIVIKKQRCKKIRQLIKKLKKHKSSYLLVKLDQQSVKILHQWGHGLDLNHQQIVIDGIPFFAKTGGKLGLIGGGGGVDLKYVKNKDIFPKPLKDALKVILTIAKIGIGVGSVVVTFGAGGDTVVESISATINSGMFYMSLIETTTTLAEQSHYMADLFKISFVDGPEVVKTRTLEIIKQILIDGNDEQISTICGILGDLLGSIAAVVGDWISTFIPDDAGIVGTAITVVINQSSKYAYRILEGFFNKIPTKFQELLKHPEKLQVFLVQILRDLEAGLRHKGPTDNKMSVTSTVGRLKKVAKQLLPGVDLAEKYGVDTVMYDILFNLIKTYFEPNIEKAIYVVGQAMPLIFVILTFNQICDNPSQIEAMKAELTVPETRQSRPVARTTPTPQMRPVPTPRMRMIEPIPMMHPVEPMPQMRPVSIPRMRMIEPIPQMRTVESMPHMRPIEPAPQMTIVEPYISTQMVPPPLRTYQIQQGGTIPQPYRDKQHDRIKYSWAKYIKSLDSRQ
jgi:hypothetical protein